MVLFLYPCIPIPLLMVNVDLFDNMFDLVDSLTFRTHSISPSMWPVFELTYELFKSDAVDFLEGKECPFTPPIVSDLSLLYRDVAFLGQLPLLRS